MNLLPLSTLPYLALLDGINQNIVPLGFIIKKYPGLAVYLPGSGKEKAQWKQETRGRKLK